MERGCGKVSEARWRGVKTCGEHTGAPAVERGPKMSMGPLLARIAPLPQELSRMPPLPLPQELSRMPPLPLPQELSRMPPLPLPQEQGAEQGTQSAAVSDMTCGRLI